MISWQPLTSSRRFFGLLLLWSAALTMLIHICSLALPLFFDDLLLPWFALRFLVPRITSELTLSYLETVGENAAWLFR